MSEVLTEIAAFEVGTSADETVKAFAELWEKAKRRSVLPVEFTAAMAIRVTLACGATMGGVFRAYVSKDFAKPRLEYRGIPVIFRADAPAGRWIKLYARGS